MRSHYFNVTATIISSNTPINVFDSLVVVVSVSLSTHKNAHSFPHYCTSQRSKRNNDNHKYEKLATTVNSVNVFAEIDNAKFFAAVIFQRRSTRSKLELEKAT